MTYINNDEQQVCFNIEVRVPYALAADFAAALTGNDDDVILAAESAMRRRLDALGAVESVELWPDEPHGGQIRGELLRAACESGHRTLDDFVLDNPPAGDGVSIIAPRGMQDY